MSVLGALVVVAGIHDAAGTPEVVVAAPPTTRADSAWIKLVRGDAHSAMIDAQSILDEGPVDARAIFCLAVAAHELDESAAMVERFELRAAADTADALAALGLGVIALERRDTAAAESLLTRSLRLLESSRRTGVDQRDVLVAREQLGRAVAGQQRWDEAITRLTDALERSQELASPVSTAYLHGRLGLALKDASRRGRSERVDDAVAQLDLAVAQAGTLDLPRWQAEAQIALSIIDRWRRDLDASLAHREAALANYERAGYVAGQADAWQRIGAIHLMRGQLTRALPPLHRAWELAEAAGADHTLGYTIMNLGGIHYFTGDSERAIELYEEAHRVARRSGDLDLAAGSQVNAGLALVAERRFDAALETYDRALGICRETGDRRGELRCLSNLGLCLYEMGEPGMAVERLDEGLVIAAELGDVGTQRAYLLRDIGLCRLALEQWAPATESLAESIALAQAMGLPTVEEDARCGLADIARATGEPHDALRLYEQALAIREGLRGRLGGTTGTGSSYFGRGGIVFEKAIDLLYELHERDPDAGHDRHAFDLAQQAKARALLDLLAESKVDLGCRADPEYRRREEEIRRQIAEHLQAAGETARAKPEERAGGESSAGAPSVEVQILRLEDELAALEVEMRGADPRYTDLRYPTPCTLAELQSTVLVADELLLDFLLGEAASYVWSISPRSFRFIRLPGRTEIDGATRELLPLLTDYNILGADPTYFVPPATRLSAALIGPLRDAIEAADDLIIVPHGILYYVPFETLLLEQPPVRATLAFGDLPYVVRTTGVTYVPSVSTLAQLRAEHGADDVVPAGDAALLLVGDPTVPSADAMSVFARPVLGAEPRPLPHAGLELRSIAALFPPASSTMLAGAQATWTAVEEEAHARSYGLVHFAAHGVFNERRPQYSGLLLTADPSTGDDGFVTIGDVFALELPCRQVTLAACSSALGENVTGEGVVGLTRAFIYAGARSVVAALWEVSGQATATFMQSFYGDLRAGSADGTGGTGPPDRARALATAKREMISGAAQPAGEGISYAHPYFWAGFVLTGDGR